MRVIKTFDSKDYDPSWPKFARHSARGIIFIQGKILLVQSEKYGECKFPGGGIKKGETKTAAMMREVREEAGMIVIPSTIQPYGVTHIVQKSYKQDKIFHQNSYYYTCQIDPDLTTAPTPERGYETNYAYRPVLMTLAEAIEQNKSRLHMPQIPWVERDTTVMLDLIASGL